MMNNNRVAIERINGVTIYGKVMGSKGKLGQYEVESDFFKSSGTVYHLYAEAEKRMHNLIGAKTGKL